MKFASTITEGPHIYEHTTVRELVDTIASTDRGKVRAKKIIVTIHFLSLNKRSSYSLRLYQHRLYIITLENTPDVGGMCMDEPRAGSSSRNYGDLPLIGGGGRRTGKQSGGWRKLRASTGRHYSHAAGKFYWATQDHMNLNGVPCIGSYSVSTTDLYVATGFNKWGMTSSMVSAVLLYDLAQGKESPYSEVFSPSWSILHRQLVTSGMEAVVNLLTSISRYYPHMGHVLK